MSYRVYKYCSESDERWLKERLDLLKVKIMDIYSGMLAPDESDKNVDFLVLNFSVIDNENYLSNFAIMYVDQRGEWRFEITFIKALDREGVRYSKKQNIADSIPLNVLESNFREYVDIALALFKSWDENALLNGDQVELGRDDRR